VTTVSSAKPKVSRAAALTTAPSHPGDPIAAVGKFLLQIPKASRVLVGYSGGLDSHVLLYALHACRDQHPDLTISAIHVDHGLQLESASWASHCEKTCRELDIPIQIVQAEVALDSAQGPEASARIARYESFSRTMQDGDYLLLAQHADDQAETFLLQALRGSGPDGLASIPRRRVFATGWLCRPLLGVNRLELEDFARRVQLDWIEDPSNQDSAFDRNFLRNEIIPLLRQRWPALNQTLSRSASRCGAASQLLLTLAAEDSLLQARQDSSGIVNVGSYQFRRYRDRLYLLTNPPKQRAFEHIWRAPFEPLTIPETGEKLTYDASVSMGLQLTPENKVQVRSRVGGELIEVGDPTYHKAVKKVLQEAGIPPWRRDSIPLLYVDGKLVAIWGVVVSRVFSPRTV